MTPKTKRRLKWVVNGMKCGDYWAFESVGCGGWNGGHKTSVLCISGTKRQAVAACERHARNNPSKNSSDLFVKGVDMVKIGGIVDT